MPGIYGSVTFVIGTPTAPKPVTSQPCVVCGSECYRQTYRVGQGWCWRHVGCDPDQPRVERRFARGHIPIGYVPASYPGERTTQFDPALAHALNRSKRETHG